jgi:hypothetical protein
LISGGTLNEIDFRVLPSKDESKSLAQRRKGKTGETDNSQKVTKITKDSIQTPLCDLVLQREVFKHFDEDSSPREDKMIHNKVAKAAKTDHCRSLVETCFVFVAFVSLL